MTPVIRLIVTGDIAAASRWVGHAKKLARDCLLRGIPRRVFSVVGATIRVECYGDQAKVFLTVLGESGQYQFVVTGPTPETSDVGTADLEFIFGSAVALRLPRITPDNPLPDWSTAKARATGSQIEGDESSAWPVLPRTAQGQSDALRIKNTVQIQNIAEPVYMGADGRRLMFAWCSVEGQVRMAGVASPLPGFASGDVTYDAAPTLLSGARVPHVTMSDADWPHDACLVKAQSERYGSRMFVVMSDAFGEFHCWPLGAQLDFEMAGSSEYAEQMYKANVTDDYARHAVPPYPEWVERPAEKCRDYWESEGKQPTSPRYVTRFHPEGSKAVVMAFERRATAWTVFGQNGRAAESEVGAAKVFDESEITGGDPTHKVSPSLDVPGWCEFSLDIEITGEALGQFEFSMTLLNFELAAETSWPVAAGYLGPGPKFYPGHEWSWSDRGVDASTGDLLIARIAAVLPEAAREAINRVHGWGYMPFSVQFKHVWLEIAKVGSETPLFSIPLRETPDSALDGKFKIPQTESRTGHILQLELATLTWVTAYLRRTFAVAESGFDTDTGVGGVDCDLRQVTVESSVGLETVVYGDVLRRVTRGSLDAFAWVDAFEPEGDRFDMSEVATYWTTLDGASCAFENSQRHWLIDKACYFLGAALAECRDDENDPDWLPADIAEFETSLLSKLLEDARTSPPYNETEPRFLGPHSAIADWCSTYTSDYWDDYVVSSLWDIFSVAVAQKAAGDDIDLATSHAYYTPCTMFVSTTRNNMFKLTSTYPGGTYHPRIYDCEVGLLAYHALWIEAFFARRQKASAYLLDNGYVAGSNAFIYHVDPVTAYVASSAQVSGEWHAITAPSGFSTPMTSELAGYAAVKPDLEESGLIYVDDFITHINGGDSSSHLVWYNSVYGKTDSINSYSLLGYSADVGNNVYHVIGTNKTKDGVLTLNYVDFVPAHYGMLSIGFNAYVPRVNGAMLFG